MSSPRDLDDAADIDRLAKEAEAAMGKLDILVNNAGITRDNISMRMKDEDWEKVLQVNLTGTFRLSRAALRGMMQPPLRADRSTSPRSSASPAIPARPTTPPPRPA